MGWSERIAWAGVWVGFVALLCHAWFGPDVWYHLNLGRQVLAGSTAQPIETFEVRQRGATNIYWLFQIILLGLYHLGGPALVTLAFAILWTQIFWILIRTCKWMKSPWGSLFFLLVIPLGQLRFEERPEVVAYLGIALLLKWMHEWDFDKPWSGGRWLRVGLTQCLLANVHGYFIFGPLLAGARWLQSLVAPPSTTHPSQVKANSGAFLGVTVLASFVNPHGAEVWRFVLRLSTFYNEIGSGIQEFRPMTGPAFSYWVTYFFWMAVFFILGLSIWAYKKQKLDLWRLLVAGAGIYLAGRSGRNVPLFIIFSMPVVAAVPLSPWFHTTRLRSWVPMVTSGLAGVLIWSAVTNRYFRWIDRDMRFGFEYSNYHYPIFFSNYLKQNKFTGLIFNNSTSGGYLAFHHPDLKLFGDSRFTDYERTNEYFDGLYNIQGLEHLHMRNLFDGLHIQLSNEQSALVGLLNSPDWQWAYSDLCHLFLVHRAHKTVTASPSDIRIYRGEDLFEGLHSVCLAKWIQGAGESRALLPLSQIVDELQEARALPIQVLGPLLEATLKLGEPRLAQKVVALSAKIQGASPSDLALFQGMVDSSRLQTPEANP